MEDKKVKISRVSCNESFGSKDNKVKKNNRNEGNEFELMRAQLNKIERGASSISSKLHDMQAVIENIMTSIKRLRQRVEEKQSVLPSRVESEDILDVPLEDASGLSMSLEERGIRKKTGHKKDYIDKDSPMSGVSISVGGIQNDNLGRELEIIGTIPEPNNKTLQGMVHSLHSMPVSESSNITGDRSNEPIKKDNREKSKLRPTREDNGRKLQPMENSLYNMPVNKSSKITGDRSDEPLKKDNAEKSKLRPTREDNGEKLQAMKDSSYNMPIIKSSNITGEWPNEAVKKDKTEGSKQHKTRDGSSKNEKQNLQEKTKDSNGSSLRNNDRKCSMSRDLDHTKKNDESNQGRETETYRGMIKKGMDVYPSAFKDKQSSRKHDPFDSLLKHSQEPVRPRTDSKTKIRKQYAERTMDRNVRTTDSFDEHMIEGHSFYDRVTDSSKTEFQPKDSNEENIMALHKKKCMADIFAELRIIKDAVERITSKLMAHKCTGTQP